MQQTMTPEREQPGSPNGLFSSGPARVLLPIVVTIAVLVVLWQGFIFLRDSTAPKPVITVVAIVWGVGGVASLFLLANWLVELLPSRIQRGVLPFVFVAPAMAILIWYLALPTVRTFYLSLLDRNSQSFVGLQNYVSVFTERFMLEAFRNNIFWIAIGATSAVVLGLLIAVLADRSAFENLAKTVIFMPMAISMVGAGIIFRFIYASRGAGDAQIGLLNAIVVALGGQPQAWLQLVQPWNNLFLIAVVVWLQTGFAMVLFSAAIKGIPAEILEASRVDGANEIQVFFQIMIPYIRGTIVTVSTTIVIFTLKIFDVVMVMTGGQFGTEVIATQFYRQNFSNRNFGLGSAIAMVLLIAVIPVMIYNLRRFREQEAF